MKNLIVDNWEIEHRFLLKRLPKEIPSYSLDIAQYYYPNNAGWARIRKEYNNNTKEFKFIHTVKTSIKPGISEEIEINITESEFNNFLKKAKNPIFKTRYVYEYQNKKWEVDKFTHFALIIAELELKYEDELYQIPEYIEKEILINITGNYKFSNLTLALNQ